MHLNIRILTIAILIIGLVAYTNRAIGQAEKKHL